MYMDIGTMDFKEFHKVLNKHGADGRLRWGIYRWSDTGIMSAKVWYSSQPGEENFDVLLSYKESSKFDSPRWGFSESEIIKDLRKKIALEVKKYKYWRDDYSQMDIKSQTDYDDYDCKRIVRRLEKVHGLMICDPIFMDLRSKNKKVSGLWSWQMDFTSIGDEHFRIASCIAVDKLIKRRSWILTYSSSAIEIVV